MGHLNSSMVGELLQVQRSLDQWMQSHQNQVEGRGDNCREAGESQWEKCGREGWAGRAGGGLRQSLDMDPFKQHN